MLIEQKENMEHRMQEVVSTFHIVPPIEVNDDVAERAVYLQDRLAAEFPGYKFEIMDLRKVKSLSLRESVIFGDGMSYTVLPLVGRTSNSRGEGGYFAPYPSRELTDSISEFCQKFDFEAARRQAA
jgi:hypothetical protein